MVAVVTVLGLFIAVYSLIPRHTRIELSLRIGRVVIILSMLLFFFIIYLNSINLLEALGLKSCLLQNFLKDNSDPITLWTFIFIFLIIIAKWSLFRLSRKKLTKFNSFISQLIQEDRIQEMADIFINYHKRILRYSESDTKYYQFIEKGLQKYPDQKKIREITAKIIVQTRVNPSTEIDSINTTKHTKRNIRKIIDRSFRNMKYHTVRKSLLLLPGGKSYRSEAREILRLAVLSPKVIKFWTHERPHDLIKLLDANIREVFEISNQLLGDQIADVKSYIYYELEDTQNYFGKEGYSIKPENFLVFSLLGNSTRADHLHVWKPVGEYILKHLDDLHNSNDDPYNRPCAEFTSEGKWSSPIYLGLHFFDVMVTTALTQNSPSNMWLFYFYYFTEKIVRNSNLVNPLIDKTDEWPNRYCYLLYEIISIQKSWILYSEHLKKPEENPIIINSFFCISQSFNKIVNHNQLPEGFIAYICEIVLGIYFDLRKIDLHVLSKKYLDELIEGKPISFSPEYRVLIEGLLGRIDSIPWRFNDKEGWNCLKSKLEKNNNN